MRAKSKPNQNKGVFASAPSLSVDPNQTPDESSSSSPEPTVDPSDQPEKFAFDSSNSVQILDFHTSNPLVSFNDQIYTCSWTTTIGTDLLLNPNQHNSVDPPNPILTTTRHKLSARPANLIPRRDPRSSVSSSSKIRPQDTVDLPSPNGSKATRIPIETHASLARQRQAAFLEKFIAIKAAKGEKDEVTVYAPKKNTGTGWRSQRKEKLARQVENETGTEKTAAKTGHDAEDGTSPAEQLIEPTSNIAQETQARPSHGRPRGRSRGPSRALPRDPNYRGRKYKGAFFKGFESHGAANPQNDAESPSIPTPRKWKDLNPTGEVIESPVDGENGIWSHSSIANQEERVLKRGVAEDVGLVGIGVEGFLNQDQDRSLVWNQQPGIQDEDIVMEEGGVIENDATEDVMME